MSALAEIGGAPGLGTNTTTFRLLGADMNTTGDQLLIPAMSFSRFIPLSIIATNASAAILLATGGIYTGPNKTGTAIVAASQSWTGLTSATKAIFPVIAPAGQALFTGNLYLSLTTAMGAPGTCDIYIMGVAS